jgi:processive 1,2-diacylglycerol beta-glucosyltransferase
VTPRPTVLFADDLAAFRPALEAALGGADLVAADAAGPDALVASDRLVLADLGRRMPGAARVGLAATYGADAVTAWPPGSADRLCVAFEAIADVLVAAGWSADAVHATGLPVPPGFAPPPDPIAARAAAGLPEPPVVVVRPSAFSVWGDVPLLLQLGLVAPDPFYLFDVGLDPALAEKLREAVPIQDLRAGLVAQGEGHAARLALADVVLGSGSLPEVAAALAAGSATIALEPDDEGALSLAAEAGAVQIVRAHARLALAIEALCDPGTLATARAAAAKLGRPTGSAAVAAVVLAAAKDAPALAAARGRPPGLPSGLEVVGRRERRPRGEASEPDVEKDLAALRERIAKGV